MDMNAQSLQSLTFEPACITRHVVARGLEFTNDVELSITRDDAAAHSFLDVLVLLCFY